MTLSNLRIGTRLALGFGIVLALLVGAIGLSIVLSSQQRAAAAQRLDLARDKLHRVGEMRAALLGTAVAMRNVGLDSDPNNMQKLAEQARTEHGRYAQALKDFEAIGPGAEERALLDQASDLDKAVDKPFYQAVALALAFNGEEAIKILATQVDPLQQKQIQIINKLQAKQEGEEQEAMQSADAAAATLNGLLIGIGVVALAVGAVLAWACTRSVTQPIRKAIRAAEAVAAGDLTARIESAGSDEISQLLGSLRTMNSSLTGIVGKVRAGVEAVSTASSQIEAGNQDLSGRTESQASALEQTAASMEQLTAAVKQSADFAHRANTLATAASEAAGKGGDMVQQVVATMQRITESSRNIAEIIGVIDGIAFQTNILALNAAVEAARAGEQGRGFAVVAGEVRTLAQRSATAAREIRGMISESVSTVEAGSRLVGDAGSSMDAIVVQVREVAALIDQITQAALEQSSGISQVNEALVQMEQTTQQNAALVEEAAAAASSMKRQATDLTDAVSAFRIETPAGA